MFVEDAGQKKEKVLKSPFYFKSQSEVKTGFLSPAASVFCICSEHWISPPLGVIYETGLSKRFFLRNSLFTTSYKFQMKRRFVSVTITVYVTLIENWTP